MNYKRGLGQTQRRDCSPPKRARWTAKKYWKWPPCSSALPKKGCRWAWSWGAATSCAAAPLRVMDRTDADHMGMLATVINCLALKDAICSLGGKAAVLSAIEMNQVCELFTKRDAVRRLEAGEIVILGAGQRQAILFDRHRGGAAGAGDRRRRTALRQGLRRHLRQGPPQVPRRQEVRRTDLRLHHRAPVGRRSTRPPSSSAATGRAAGCRCSVFEAFERKKIWKDALCGGGRRDHHSLTVQNGRSHSLFSQNPCAAQEAVK